MIASIGSGLTVFGLNVYVFPKDWKCNCMFSCYVMFVFTDGFIDTFAGILAIDLIGKN